MIGMLRGKLHRIADDHIIVDTGGVGYLVYCDSATLQKLAGNNQSVELSIETQVREDAITLYGFLDDDHRDWFKRLIGIQGVGARSALALLAVLSPDRLAMAIMSGDKAPLTKAAGVGPKLAGRIVAELKDRLPAIASAGTTVAAAGSGQPSSAQQDAIAALTQLGYARSDVFAVVSRLAAGDDRARVDDLIKAGLRELAR